MAPRSVGGKLATRLRLPVLGGPLRGAWWLPASGGKLLRVLSGSYEPDQSRLFRAHVGPGDVLLDIGAHVGYYTLLASRLVGPTGRVHAFEPNPGNLRFLRAHVRANGAGNVEISAHAVAEREGTARFRFGTGSGTGRLAEAGDVEVRVTSLDAWAARHGVAPSALKIDVEGAEVALLRGAREVLERDRPTLFLSTHGPEVHREALAVVRGLGYEVRPIQRADVEADSELLCVHPGRRPSAGAWPS